MKSEFGKKLEEARTRQGISVKQASDALKIRSDFLLAYENDNGDFDMPEIYKRGFLKLYARYLKLDPVEMVNEYTTFHKGSSLPKKALRDERAVLGRMDLSTKDTSDVRDSLQPSLPFNTAPEPVTQEFNTGLPQTPPPAPAAPKPKRDSSSSDNIDSKALYMKIGLIFGGTLAAFILIAVLITNLMRPSVDTDHHADLVAAADTDSLFDDSLELTEQSLLEQLVIAGDDDVDVVIRQETDKKRLFSGKVTPSSPITVTRKGPVKIHFSNGSKLSITKADGKKVRPGREGVGWIEL